MCVHKKLGSIRYVCHTEAQKGHIIHSLEAGSLQVQLSPGYLHQDRERFDDHRLADTAPIGRDQPYLQCSGFADRLEYVM